MVSAVAQILWVGLLSAWEWIPYSVIDGTVYKLTYLPWKGSTANPAPIQLIVWGLESGQSVHRIP